MNRIFTNHFLTKDIDDWYEVVKKEKGIPKKDLF